MIHAFKKIQWTTLIGSQPCGLVVDASRQGNLTRFINHAPHPTANAVAALGLVGGVRKVGVRAARVVLEGEEVLLDYGRTWWRS